MDPIVLVDVKSDGSCPDWQEVGWLLRIEDGKLVVDKGTGIVTWIPFKKVKRLVFLEEASNG